MGDYFSYPNTNSNIDTNTNTNINMNTNTTINTNYNFNNEYPRFQPEHQTCFSKNHVYLVEGFFNTFKDSFCYSFVIQFLLVSLLYSSVGKGVYWKVLFYASLSGLIGALIENFTVSYICLQSQRNEERSIFFILFLVNEFFWITTEYAIPYLNLIKMKAFAHGGFAKVMRYSIIGLIVPYIFFRLLIGYTRMKRGYLQDRDIQTYHGYAFGAMALADLMCTFSILYFVRQNNIRAISNLDEYIKHSSYTILVCVDIVSTLLSILNIITNMSTKKLIILNSLTIPLYCFKSSFILILAIDAFLFKYGANVSTLQESTTTKSYINYNLNNNNNNNNNNSSSLSLNYYKSETSLSNYNSPQNTINNKSNNGTLTSKSNHNISMNEMNETNDRDNDSDYHSKYSNHKKSKSSSYIHSYTHKSKSSQSSINISGTYYNKLNEESPMPNNGIIKNYSNLQNLQSSNIFNANRNSSNSLKSFEKYKPKTFEYY